MKRDSLQNIIDLAVEREQEAVDFYKKLASEAEVPSVAEELERLADMEAEHRDSLKTLAFMDVPTMQFDVLQDLKIEDYMVESRPCPDMSWEDVVDLAMHREAAAMRLYRNMALFAPNPADKQLFERLAAEEMGHKHFFESTWDDLVMTEN